MTAPMVSSGGGTFGLPIVTWIGSARTSVSPSGRRCRDSASSSWRVSVPRVSDPGSMMILSAPPEAAISNSVAPGTAR